LAELQTEIQTEKGDQMKKWPILIGLILIIVLAVILSVTGKPYKQTSFVVDGENYSAVVQENAALILNLKNDDEKGEWMIASSSDVFASDFSNATETGTEFHMIPLEEGTGEMVFHYVKDDGTIETYTLALSISRHQKTYLQIDSVSFTNNE
jgi:hypothetical protein